jgi:hypothetical protein
VWDHGKLRRGAADFGYALTGHRTPPERVADLAAHFTTLGIDPEAPRPVG